VLDCREPGRDALWGAPLTSLLGVFISTGAAGRSLRDPMATREFGGGVGKAFGGMDGEPSAQGGVAVPERRAESCGRGVDPLDPVPGPCIGVL